MKVTTRQSTKRVTRHEIIVTPDEAIKLIQGLAAGVRATMGDNWSRYNSGFFLMDEFNNAMVLVEKE